MKPNDALAQDRRRFLRTAGAAAASLALGGLPLASRGAGEAMTAAEVRRTLGISS